MSIDSATTSDSCPFPSEAIKEPLILIQAPVVICFTVFSDMFVVSKTI